MDYSTQKEAVLKLLEPWVGVRSAEPLTPNESAEDECEVRVFDWDKIKNLEMIAEGVSDIFGDCDDDDFEGLRAQEQDQEWVTLADNWLPIAITGTGGQAFTSHDDEDFYFPQYSYIVLVNLNEFDGPATPLYCLEVDGTAIPSPAVPRFKVSGAEQSIGSWSLCEPVNPAGDM